MFEPKVKPLFLDPVDSAARGLMKGSAKVSSDDVDTRQIALFDLDCGVSMLGKREPGEPSPRLPGGWEGEKD
jgi:hypothetical protein